MPSTIGISMRRGRPVPRRLDANRTRATSTAAIIALGLSVVLAVAGAPGVPAVAQPQSSSDEPALKVVTVDGSDYPRIDAIVTVPKLLSGQRLEAQDWVVLEGDEPRPVEVRPFDPAALEVVAVLDATIEGPPFVSAQGALMELPVHLAQPTMAVVSAGATPVVALAPTRDRGAMSTAILGLTSSPGPNGLEDGLILALDQFSPAGVRRAILVITDELDVDPERINRTIGRARREGAAVFVVSLGRGVAPEIEQLAYHTGGASWVVNPREAPLGIVPAIDEFVAELRGQYQLVVELRGADPDAPVTAAVSSTGVTASGPLRYLTRGAAAPIPVVEGPSRTGRFLGVESVVLALAAIVVIVVGVVALNARYFLYGENVLKKRHESKYYDVGVLRSDDLESQGKAVVGEAGTDGAGGRPGEVERVGVEDPVRFGHAADRSVFAD
jgi:hypothetical protein